MALVLISCLVLGPLAILAIDVIRGIGGRERPSAPAEPVLVDEDGYRIRAPRPNWPAPLDRST